MIVELPPVECPAPVNDPIDVFKIPPEHNRPPVIYRRLPSEIIKRGDKLRVNDLIAVAGPTQDQPFFILKIKKLRTRDFDFQYYDLNENGKYKLLKPVITQLHLWATYLHWGFHLNRDGSLKPSTYKSISMHEHAWPVLEQKKNNKRKRV